ncbi:mechanosensitive ion channel family protein [Halovulum sp. GXIMD14793]
MEDVTPQIRTLFDDAQDFVLSLMQPWRFYQLLIIIALVVVAHFIALWLSPKVVAWIRSLKGMNARQLRFLSLINRRLRGITLALLSWVTYLVMQEATWPSRSFLIGIFATLVTGWVFVAVASRFIKNPALREVARWGALAFVTLSVLGQTEKAGNILDSIALSVGDARISLLLVLRAAVWLIVLIMLARWLSRFFDKRLEANKDISPSFRVLASKVLHAVLYTVAVIVGLQVIGFNLTSLTVLSGAIGLGIGFGLQKVVSNLVSGVIVLIDKSIKPGDVISLGETFGWVSELNARFVAVITRDGKEYLIPNEDLITNQVVNWTHSSDLVRLDIYFGVSYDSDPHFVRKLAREAAATVGRVVDVPSPVCHIVGFGDSSIDFILRFWIKDPSGGLTNVRGDVYLALWDALKRENIEIPFPRRDVTVLKSPDMPALPD